MIRQKTADKRADECAADGTGGKRAQRPAGAFDRYLGSNQGIGIRHKAAQQPEQGAQEQQLPDILRKAHQQHDNRHTKRGAQQHQLTAFAVREFAPERGSDGGKQEGNTECRPRPQIELLMVCHPELFHIERQKGHDQAEGGAGQKTAEPHNIKISFPVTVGGFVLHQGSNLIPFLMDFIPVMIEGRFTFRPCFEATVQPHILLRGA